MDRKIPSERISQLFQEAEKAADSTLSNRYVELARKISMKYKTRIPAELRRRFCKSCNHYLVPGLNCRVRTRSKSVICYCLDCKHYSRHPFAREKK